MGKPSLKIAVASGALDYQSLFSAAPAGFLILDSDLVIVEVNEAYCRLTMTKRNNIIGQSVFAVFPDNPNDSAADGVRNVRASFGRVLKFRRTDAIAALKFDIRGPQGGFETRYWNSVNSPVLGEDGKVQWIIHHADDVTELIRVHGEGVARDQLARDKQLVIDEQQMVKRELAETHLAVTEKENVGLQGDRLYLADIVESSNDAIIAKTLDGIVISWNWAAEQLFGYSPEEMIGTLTRRLYPPDLMHEIDEILVRLKSGERVDQFETRRLRKDGTEVLVSLTASLIKNSSAKITGVSMILRDVTEHRRGEERLHGLQADLIHLSRWNTMGMLASTIAHELNQPMTAVLNYVRAAQNSLKTIEDAKITRARGYLDDAIAEAKLVGGIILSLREFIEKRESQRVRENFNTVVEEAIALSHVRGHDVKARLHVKLEPSNPFVLVDKVQIQQVVFNLIRNSIDAMQGCEQAVINICTTCDEPGFVTATVSDTGPGIAPDIMKRLFQPFVTTKERGMGVGLTICQSIIEAHGGRIWATPNQDKGVCFHFTLPMAASMEDSHDA